MRKIIVAVLLALPFVIHAQRSEIGVFGGVSYYMGDLNPTMPYELMKPAYGIVYRYNFNTRLALKATAWQGTVSGDDMLTEFRADRALNFTSSINELSAQIEFNFLNYFTGGTRSYVSPYIFGGMGVFLYDPKAVYNGQTFKLRNELTEGVDYSILGQQFPALSMCFPFGIGVKYSISKVFGFSLEWGMRKTMTDYIDDVSTVYPQGLVGSKSNPNPNYPVDPSGLFSQGMQRGNSKDNDWYSFAGAMLTVKLNYNKRASCDEKDKIRF